MSTILTSSDRSAAARARSFAGSALRGASSVAKTQVLRRGRASDEQYQQRLAICQNCPGGHATFKADGSLHTCGPMVKSMARPGGKTCGCVLSQKARDVKQDCPSGYWPTIEGRHETANRHEKASADEQRPRIWTPGAPQIVTPHCSGRHVAGRPRGSGGVSGGVSGGGGPGWSRRSFLQYGAAAAGGLLLPHAAARAAGADCYTLKDCDGMQPDLFTNTDLSSSVGKVVKLVGGDTCWQVTADGTGSPVVLTVDQTFDDCDDCGSVGCTALTEGASPPAGMSSTYTIFGGPVTTVQDQQWPATPCGATGNVATATPDPWDRTYTWNVRAWPAIDESITRTWDGYEVFRGGHSRIWKVYYNGVSWRIQGGSAFPLSDAQADVYGDRRCYWLIWIQPINNYEAHYTKDTGDTPAGTYTATCPNTVPQKLTIA